MCGLCEVVVCKVGVEWWCVGDVGVYGGCMCMGVGLGRI